MVAKKQSLESQIKAGGSDGEVQRRRENLANVQQQIAAQASAIAAAKQEIAED